MQGCTFENAGASVDMLIMRRDRQYRQPFRVLEFSVISSNRGGTHSESEDDEVGEPSSGHCGDWLEAQSSHVNQAIVKLLVGNKVKVSSVSCDLASASASEARLRFGLKGSGTQLQLVL